MLRKEAARRCCHMRRALGSGRTREIVPDFERAALCAGLLFAASFGGMFVWAAVMF